MDPNSPFYQFHPDSIGWLHRRAWSRQEITATDLARLLKADSTNASDAVMVRYLVEHCEGRLKRKRGRKPPEPVHFFKLYAASIFVKERADEIKAERKLRDHKHVRGDFEPSVQAANEIGRWLRLPAGRSLLNAISALEK